MKTNRYEKQREELMLIRTKTTDQCFKEVEDGSRQSCSRVTKDLYCDTYVQPDKKWRLGDCNMADPFLKKEFSEEKKKIRIGQQKQSKKKKSRK